MGKGFKSGAGGGNPLNFKVIDGTTEPANPKKNWIWVNTDKKITGHYFSATQPENMAEGEVWFLIGNSTAASFNALKKNCIQVCPVSAKQYINGVLMTVPAKIYSDDGWKDFDKVIVPNAENYGRDAWTLNGKTATVDATDNETVFVLSPYNQNVAYALVPVDISAYSTMTLDGICSDTSGSSGGVPLFAGLFSAAPSHGNHNFTTGFTKDAVHGGDSISIKNSYDLSALPEGSYLFGIAVPLAHEYADTHTLTLRFSSVKFS
jgi:hypothetical protein